MQAGQKGLAEREVQAEWDRQCRVLERQQKLEDIMRSGHVRDGLIAFAAVAAWWLAMWPLVYFGGMDGWSGEAVIVATMLVIVWGALRLSHKEKAPKPDGDEVPF